VPAVLAAVCRRYSTGIGIEPTSVGGVYVGRGSCAEEGVPASAHWWIKKVFVDDCCMDCWVIVVLPDALPLGGVLTLKGAIRRCGVGHDGGSIGCAVGLLASGDGLAVWKETRGCLQHQLCEGTVVVVVFWALQMRAS
jgi:hypothetical protein